MIESLRNDLITLRTEGLVNAMQSMKDIEALFDKVTSNYRPLLNGERLCRSIGIWRRKSLFYSLFMSQNEDFCPKSLSVQEKVVPLPTINPTTLLVRKASAPGWDFVFFRISAYEIYEAGYYPRRAD